MADAGISFGAWLKQKRLAMGWTQYNLEAESGVLQGTISKLETGKINLRNASRETVQGLAEALQEPLPVLLRAAGIEEVAGLSPAVLEMAYKAQHLGEEELLLVDHMIQGLLEIQRKRGSD